MCASPGQAASALRSVLGLDPRPLDLAVLVERDEQLEGLVLEHQPDSATAGPRRSSSAPGAGTIFKAPNEASRSLSPLIRGTSCFFASSVKSPSSTSPFSAPSNILLRRSVVAASSSAIGSSAFSASSGTSRPAIFRAIASAWPPSALVRTITVSLSSGKRENSVEKPGMPPPCETRRWPLTFEVPQP